MGLDEERSLQKNGEYTASSLARILIADASGKEREKQLARTTHELRKRVAQFVEVDGRIFEYLL